MQITVDSLRDPTTREAFATRVREDIDNFCLDARGKHKSARMPASELAEDCARFLWFMYRWADFEEISPRMARFLERGNWAEKRFVDWLKGAGYAILDVDPTASERRLNKQFRVRICSGHVGGFLDGQIPMTPYGDVPFLFECKAISTKAFSAVVNNGVRKERPKYYGQMCTYGKEYGLHYGLFCVINRNDDDIHIECVELDWSFAEDLERKARDIVASNVPPPRIAENPSYFKCKMCRFVDVCHYQKMMQKSCRTCQHGEPIENGEWRCNYFDGRPTIPRDVMQTGCEAGYVQLAK